MIASYIPAKSLSIIRNMTPNSVFGHRSLLSSRRWPALQVPFLFPVVLQRLGSCLEGQRRASGRKCFPQHSPHTPAPVPPGLRAARCPGLLGVPELLGGAAEDRRVLRPGTDRLKHRPHCGSVELRHREGNCPSADVGLGRGSACGAGERS